MGVHDITITLLKFSGFRQKLINGSDETQMEEEDVLAVGYEVTVSSLQQFLLFSAKSIFPTAKLGSRSKGTY